MAPIFLVFLWFVHDTYELNFISCFSSPGPNLIKLLGAYLGAYRSQINRVRHLNKRLKVL